MLKVSIKQPVKHKQHCIHAQHTDTPNPSLQKSLNQCYIQISDKLYSLKHQKMVIFEQVQFLHQYIFFGDKHKVQKPKTRCTEQNIPLHA